MAVQVLAFGYVQSVLLCNEEESQLRAGSRSGSIDQEATAQVSPFEYVATLKATLPYSGLALQGSRSLLPALGKMV